MISKYTDYIKINLFHAFTRFYINFLNHVKITLNNVQITLNSHSEKNAIETWETSKESKQKKKRKVKHHG